MSAIDSPSEHERGLMDIESLPADEGMAFVFQEPTQTSFWMKDTLIPLSIAFVDEEGVVVGVRTCSPAKPTRAAPTASIPFVLAVEANLGWFADHAIGAGDRASLEVSAYL